MHFSDKNKPQFTKAHQNKLPKNKIKIENNSGKLFTKIPGIFLASKKLFEKCRNSAARF